MSEWRDVPGFPLYQASDDGRVRCLRAAPPRVLVQLPIEGYPTVLVRMGKGRHTKKRVPVHRLVLLAFKGVPSPGLVCRHVNGLKADNRPDNLEWGTNTENFLDAVLHGTAPCTKPRDEHPATKFTTATIDAMRAMRDRGASDKAIAARFKTNPWYARKLMNTVGA